MLRTASVLPFVALLLGCSSSSSNAATSGDVGTDAGADVADTRLPPDAKFDSVDLDEISPPDVGKDVADGGCAAVTNIALQVTEQNVAKDLPTGGGGLIADGTYTITDVTHYTGVGGPTGPGSYKVTETMMITGGANVAGVRQEGDALGYQYAADIAPISGGQLLWKQTCPEADGITYDYTASPDALIVYDTTAHTGTTYTLKFHTPGT